MTRPCAQLEAAPIRGLSKSAGLVQVSRPTSRGVDTGDESSRLRGHLRLRKRTRLSRAPERPRLGMSLPRAGTNPASENECKSAFNKGSHAKQGFAGQARKGVILGSHFPCKP